MLFDKNYNKLIEILGKYDENFLKDYNEFIAKFPSKLIEKAEEGKEFSKKVKGSKLSCFIDDKYNEYRWNMSMLEKNDTFSKLQVYRNTINDMSLMGVNGVLELIVGRTYFHQKSYSFEIYLESGKKILKVTFDNGIPQSKDGFRREEHELTDAEFEFIAKTISEFVKKEQTINL